MITVNFTEFGKNASELFSSVEGGEIIQVLKHGKKIAEILPMQNEIEQQPSWEKKRTKLTVQGESLSEIFIEEREHG